MEKIFTTNWENVVIWEEIPEFEDGFFVQPWLLSYRLWFYFLSTGYLSPAS